MSFLKKEITKRIDNFVLSRFQDKVIFQQEEMLELKKKTDYYEEQLGLPSILKALSTPAPTTGDFAALTMPEPAIRLPRIPYNEFVYYLMRWNSSILRMICKVIKQEIFRETRKEGFEWEAKFKVKCTNCGSEYETEEKECDFCHETELKPPNPAQKKLLEPFIKEANKAEQTLLEMYEEIEDDHNTVDDGYMVIIKDYLSGPGGIYGEAKEFMRGDPSQFRIVSDISGRRGGKWWICPNHRDVPLEKESYQKKQKCDKCGLPLLDVHYVETEVGGVTPVKYYIKGEVVHASKYEPSRLYGIPPVFSVYIITRTIQLMDIYTENLYEKGRLKGILAVPTENQKQLKKWIDEVLGRLRDDPHYLPWVGVPTGPDKRSGKMEYVKLIDSMEELQYQEHRRMLKEEIAGVYGVSLVFLSDPSAGTGLTNEGLQITVTDRAIEWGQAVYHDQYFPKLLEVVGITDWILKLKPSREMDEMAELQRFHQRVQTARELQQMGYELDLKDEQFEVRGKAHVIANPSEQQQDFFSPSSQRLLPAGQGEKPILPQPQNREGVKDCPPGMIATPENPRCHPIEWESQEKALTEIKKLGDSMAHIICLRRKMFKAGIPEPEFTPEQKKNWPLAWWNWSEATKKIDPLFKKICGTCNKAGEMGAKPDADWLDPYDYPFGDDEWKNTPVFPNETIKAGESGKPYPWDKCMKDMKARYGSEEIARKVCAKIKRMSSLQREFEKGYGPDPSPGSINAGKRLKVFDMERVGDESGISGTGLVASGIVYPDGHVALRWNSETSSTILFDSFEEFKKIHIDPHPKNKTKLHYYDLKEGDIKEFTKAVEAGGKVEAEKEKIETHFANQLLEAYQKRLVKRLTDLDDKSTSRLMSEIDEIVAEAQPVIEKLAFSEVLRAYKKGKQIDVSPETKKDIHLPKNVNEPFRAKYGAFGIDKEDWQVLRAIYRKNPFWNAFSGMSQSISDKIKEHITESYEAPNSARMKATIRDVEREYPGISKERAESIAYGRIGKFSIAKMIEKMRRTLNTEVYRLERIARTETTGITALGREMAFKARDPENLFKYDWFGPQDHRTSEICTWIKKEVARRGQGKGVSLDELDEIMREANEKFMAKSWNYRKYVPHANCRHVLRRVNI